MLEMSDRHVASVTQQAADSSGIVTVINVKRPAPSGVGRRAYSALPVLLGEHLVVGAERETVVRAPIVLARLLRVLSTPLARLAGGVFEIVAAPLVLALVRAQFAVRLHARRRVSKLVKLGEWLSLPALGAALDAGGEIELFSLRHRSTRIKTSCLCQGVK